MCILASGSDRLSSGHWTKSGTQEKAGGIHSGGELICGFGCAGLVPKFAGVAKKSMAVEEGLTKMCDFYVKHHWPSLNLAFRIMTHLAQCRQFGQPVGIFQRTQGKIAKMEAAAKSAHAHFIRSILPAPAAGTVFALAKLGLHRSVAK
jgi:hypothetical protein